MPRSIVTGNGNLLAAFNSKNMLEDLYFPYVGMEDQIAFQRFHRIGMQVDGNFTWLYEDSWECSQAYMPGTLVTHSISRNKKLGLEVVFSDFVYPFDDFLMRKITIRNQTDQPRSIKVFFGLDFNLYGSKQLDTAFYEPEHKAMVHFRQQRYFWVSGMTEQHTGISSFTTGKSEYRGLEGTWRDAEDGNLHENPIEQGSVDSTIQFNVGIKPQSHTTLHVWMCAGRTLKEVSQMHKMILEEKPEVLLENTVNYWRSWINKDRKEDRCIEKELVDHYKQSLLIIRTQIDNRGAIIAANDSDIMKFNKDTYSYMWPRDGAWVAMALDRAGYGEISDHFFEFCSQIMTDSGYLLPKYNADESVGSSWHPWYKDGQSQLPIQEDETGIVIHALWKHFERYRNIEFIQEMFRPLIRRAGNFMMNFVDAKRRLPLPSYDLWERERGIFAYTCATVYAGLKAAANLSETLGHFTHKKNYDEAAQRLKDLILEYLYDEEGGRFLKRIQINELTGEIQKDTLMDASLHGLWMMGVLPPDDERIVRTNQEMMKKLWVPTQVGGLTRSERDDYQRISDNYGNIEGNPWIITTLWHAQWLMAIAKSKEDLAEPKKLIDWAVSHMNSAGILPEQLNPWTGEPLSVAPLTWSHSTFVDTVLQYEEKLERFYEKSNDIAPRSKKE